MFCDFFSCIFHSVGLQQWWWGPTIMTILLLGKGDDDDQAQRHQPGDDDDDDDKHCWSGWIYQPGDDDDDESEEDKQCWSGQKAPTWWKRWWWQWPWCPAPITSAKFFNLALFVAKFVAQGDCIPYTLAIQPNEPYSNAMPLLIDTVVFDTLEYFIFQQFQKHI